MKIKALANLNLKPNFTSNISSQLVYKIATRCLCFRTVLSSVLKAVNTLTTKHFRHTPTTAKAAGERLKTDQHNSFNWDLQ